jgi:hypothetical protein
MANFTELNNRNLRRTNMAMANPPPAFATTSTETINCSIESGFAVLNYIPPQIFRALHVDSVDFRHDI